MIDELLERAVTFFRLGRAARGAVCLQGFLEHKDRKDDLGLVQIHDGMRRGDYLMVADVLDQLLSLYR